VWCWLVLRIYDLIPRLLDVISIRGTRSCRSASLLLPFLSLYAAKTLYRSGGVEGGCQGVQARAYAAKPVPCTVLVFDACVCVCVCVWCVAACMCARVCVWRVGGGLVGYVHLGLVESAVESHLFCHPTMHALPKTPTHSPLTLHFSHPPMRFATDRC
jgi:hypothetical protein